MELEERKAKENIFNEIKDISFIKELNEQKLSLRRKKISQIFSIKRRNNLEKIKNYSNFMKIEPELQINKFSSSFDRIILNLKSSDNNIQSYTLKQLNIYFQYYEPDINEQKMIMDGQFLELLLNLGIKFSFNDETNIIQILCIFINIQIYNEGNGEYLISLYSDKFFEFYNKCFIQSKSDEIVNKIILLLYYMANINCGINIKILQSRVFESIINFSINEDQDLGFKELIIKLITICLNISKNCELDEKETKIIDKCLTILKNESIKGNEKIKKICYQGLYNISKINDDYEFNKKMINEEIPRLILETKNKNILLYSLKTLTNILTVPDEYLDQINLEEIISYYNSIINLYKDEDKIIYIILNGICNIADSKYINVVKSSIIWDQIIIQILFNKNEDIQLLFIEIIKYIIKSGNLDNLKFIFNTKILEYLIYLISNSIKDKKIIIKFLELIDNYLSRFRNCDKDNAHYLVIYNKFKDFLFCFHDLINEENNFFEYIKKKYK